MNRVEYAIALVENLPKGTYDTRGHSIDAEVKPYTTLLESGVDRYDCPYLKIDSDYEEFLSRGVETIRDLLFLLKQCRKLIPDEFDDEKSMRAALVDLEIWDLP